MRRLIVLSAATFNVCVCAAVANANDLKANRRDELVDTKAKNRLSMSAQRDNALCVGTKDVKLKRGKLSQNSDRGSQHLAARCMGGIVCGWISLLSGETL